MGENKSIWGCGLCLGPGATRTWEINLQHAQVLYSTTRICFTVEREKKEKFYNSVGEERTSCLEKRCGVKRSRCPTGNIRNQFTEFKILISLLPSFPEEETTKWLQIHTRKRKFLTSYVLDFAFRNSRLTLLSAGDFSGESHGLTSLFML